MGRLRQSWSGWVEVEFVQEDMRKRIDEFKQSAIEKVKQLVKIRDEFCPVSR